MVSHPFYFYLRPLTHTQICTHIFMHTAPSHKLRRTLSHSSEHVCLKKGPITHETCSFSLSLHLTNSLSPPRVTWEPPVQTEFLDLLWVVVCVFSVHNLGCKCLNETEYTCKTGKKKEKTLLACIYVACQFGGNLIHIFNIDIRWIWMALRRQGFFHSECKAWIVQFISAIFSHEEQGTRVQFINHTDLNSASCPPLQAPF